MRKMSIVAALALTTSLTTALAPAYADKSVEVMHFWTSGGEAAALATIRDAVTAQGVTWVDAPVAGGGGDQAKTVLQARITAGDPPADADFGPEYPRLGRCGPAGQC